MASVVVEEVGRGKDRTRFVELPQLLHGTDPRFAPLVLTWERYRVDVHRNPYLDRADAALFLARRAGRLVGRIAAHLPEEGAGEGAEEGRFGFWAVADDDRGLGDALLGAAAGWLAERGCRAMQGPWSFEPGDEPGQLAEGFAAPGTTGRPWRPEWELGLLEAAGGEVAAEARTWRVPTADLGREPVAGGDRPGQAGPHVDPRLVLGAVAAVPDLSEHLRTSGLRGAWALARRVRQGDFEGCTVVRCAGDPATLVPDLLTAAARAGYAWVVSPWAPDPGAAPETVHRTYRFDL